MLPRTPNPLKKGRCFKVKRYFKHIEKSNL